MRLRNTIGSLWQGDWNTKLVRIRKLQAIIVAAALLAGTGQVRAQFIFGEPENLGPVVNTPYGDGAPSISPDGLTLFFASTQPGGEGSGDLWMTTRASTADPWETPVNLGPPVNSPDHEWSPDISADGLTLFFKSGHPDGDIWVTTRLSTSDPWQPPVNLSVVNSSTWDGSPDISADGLTLLFSSIRSGGIGYTNDLWMSTRSAASDPWGPPVNLGPPLNVRDAEWAPSLSTDGLTMFFNSNRCGSFGGWDLYMTTRPTVADPWQAAVNLGPQINTADHDREPEIWADGMTLFFASDRPGGSGTLDIWQLAVMPVCAGDLNGVCEPFLDEDCLTCPADCWSGTSAGCGNGVCEPSLDEDCLSCPEDCSGKQQGRPADRFCCGDCDEVNPRGCDDPRCTTDGFDCSDQPVSSTCCGDGSCEGTESGFNCEVDCGPPPYYCGDGNCDQTETPCNCSSDCGAPPASETNCIDGINEDCDEGTDCNDADCADDPACQATWEIEIVTTPGWAGPWTALAYDAVGNPSIGYGNFTEDRRADLASWDGSGWQIEAVTPRFSAAAIDHAYDLNGNPSLTHMWNGKVSFSRRFGSVWDTETIGQSRDATSLAYDHASNPTVAYIRQDDLHFARWNGSSFDVETVEAGGVVIDVSLAYDPATGNPTIAYSADLGSGDHDTLKFARWDGVSWAIEIVETGTPGFGAYASLAYDPVTAYPAIVHINYESGCVRFVRFDGSVWADAEIVDCAPGAASWSSLAIDSGGTAYVAYVVDENQIRVAQRAGAAWQVEMIDAGGSFGGTSLALDPDTELPSVSYCDYTGDHDDLIFVRKVPLP